MRTVVCVVCLLRGRLRQKFVTEVRRGLTEKHRCRNHREIAQLHHGGLSKKRECKSQTPDPCTQNPTALQIPARQTKRSHGIGDAAGRSFGGWMEPYLNTGPHLRQQTPLINFWTIRSFLITLMESLFFPIFNLVFLTNG